MEAGTHPSVEGIKQAVQSKGGTLSCPLCGREEFALEEVSVMSAGMAEAYGTRRVQRGQLVQGVAGGEVGAPGLVGSVAVSHRHPFPHSPVPWESIAR